MGNDGCAKVSKSPLPESLMLERLRGGTEELKGGWGLASTELNGWRRRAQARARNPIILKDTTQTTPTPGYKCVFTLRVGERVSTVTQPRANQSGPKERGHDVHMIKHSSMEDSTDKCPIVKFFPVRSSMPSPLSR